MIIQKQDFLSKSGFSLATFYNGTNDAENLFTIFHKPSIITSCVVSLLNSSILLDNLVPFLGVIPLDVRQSSLDLAQLIRGALRTRPSQDQWCKSCRNETVLLIVLKVVPLPVL